jgi:hypothetical protein
MVGRVATVAAAQREDVIPMTAERISGRKARAIAQAWAAVDEPDVRVDVTVEPVDDGFMVESVVYFRDAPFEPVGRAFARIGSDGRLEKLNAA